MEKAHCFNRAKVVCDKGISGGQAFCEDFGRAFVKLGGGGRFNRPALQQALNDTSAQHRSVSFALHLEKDHNERARKGSQLFRLSYTS